MISDKHFRSVSSAAARRLGIMRNSWQVFHYRWLLLRSFWSIVLAVCEYCSKVLLCWWFTPWTVGQRCQEFCFFNWRCLECNPAHRRSVAVLCMPFNIKSNPMLLWAVHCLCRMCRLVLLVVLWLLFALFCASSHCYFSVPQDLYAPLSVSLERSWWPCVWWCGTGRL